VKCRDLREVKCSEVSYSEVSGDKITMYISVTLN